MKPLRAEHHAVAALLVLLLAGPGHGQYCKSASDAWIRRSQRKPGSRRSPDAQAPSW